MTTLGDTDALGSEYGAHQGAVGTLFHEGVVAPVGTSFLTFYVGMSPSMPGGAGIAYFDNMVIEQAAWVTSSPDCNVPHVPPNALPNETTPPADFLIAFTGDSEVIRTTSYPVMQLIRDEGG